MTLAPDTAAGPLVPLTGTSIADDLARHGARPALIFGGQVLSFRDLAARVDEIGERLGGERRLVLLSAANDPDTIATYLAALRGRHPIVLAGRGQPALTEQLVARYDPDVVAGAGADGWRLDERRDGSRHDLHPELALLLTTSGSTGSPKLVRLSQHNLLANAASIAEYLDIRPSDRAATTLPPQYCYGLSVINSHLWSGASLLLTEQSVVDPCFWDAFTANGATTFAGVPHTFELLDRSGFSDRDLPSLRYITQAGGRLDPATVRRYAELGRRKGWDLFVMYGQTEATARMAYLPPDEALTHGHTIGRAIPGGRLEIEPFEGAAAGTGELVYHGPNVMLGYAEDPDDLAAGRDITTLRTGDVARLGEGGRFEIVGRRSRVAKLFGVRIDLDDLERVLRANGTEAWVVATGERIVVGIQGGTDPSRVAATVAGQLEIPESRVTVTELAELPRLATGKPDYAALARIAARPEPEPEPEAEPEASGSTGHPDTVRDLFARTLCTRVGDDDTFVSLGGDSLSYVEVSLRLESILGTLPEGWHVTPVRELDRAGRAGRVDRSTGAAEAAGRTTRRVTVETNLVLRALGIALIVAHHTRVLELAGSAHVLLGVAGFNFARFTLGSGQWLRSALRIAVPSMCWIGLVAVFSPRFGLRDALLVNGWLAGRDGWWGYWFVESLVQILVVAGAVTALPPVRRLARRHPFETALTFTALALLPRFGLVDIPAVNPRVFRPHEVAWIFGIGWAAAQARRTSERLILTGVAAAAIPGFFDRSDQPVLAAAGLLLLIWRPRLAVPPSLARPLGLVAGASLAIYLTHWQVFPVLEAVAGRPGAFAGSVAFGVAVSAAAGWGARHLTRFRPG